MELFDIKYVYMEWDDCLKDKRVFASDSLQLMRTYVNNPDDNVITDYVENNSNDSELYPFILVHSALKWGLVYYDPNYKCKVAYAQGKQIQVKNGDFWADVEKPIWSDNLKYRVKPDGKRKSKTCITCRHDDKGDYSCVECDATQSKWEEQKKKRRMTNRELARWLAEGKGECLQNTIAFAVWNYLAENKDKPVSDAVMIRGWDETEWSDPLIEE